MSKNTGKFVVHTSREAVEKVWQFGQAAGAGGSGDGEGTKWVRAKKSMTPEELAAYEAMTAEIRKKLKAELDKPTQAQAPAHLTSSLM